MKKILMGTTAVVALATMSTEAFAADKISLGLGGFMRHYLGYTNSDEVTATSGGATRGLDLGQWSNTEVYFTGSTTLDNGLTVAARVEMEADGENGGNNTDRSFVTVSSDAMGALTLGTAGHAGDDFRVAAPSASNFDWGDFENWANYAGTAGGATAANSRQSTSDLTDMGDNSAKVKYVSPVLGDMVTVFASYSAAEGSGSADGRNLLNGGTASSAQDGSTIGASVSGEFGGAAVDAALIQYNSGASNYDVTNFGLNVGMAGFTVGGSYADFSDKQTGSNALDGNAWDLGVGYETGPYAVAVRYYNSTNQDTTATAGDNEDTIWALDATYDLGAGVVLAATYFNQSSDPEGTATSRDTNGIIAGIEVGF